MDTATGSEAEMPLLVRDDDGVRTLTMNRPSKRNALNEALVVGLRDALRDAAEASTVRVVVLTGAGGAFCSGADLSDPAWPDLHPAERMRRMSKLVLELHELPKPVIAKVGGDAVGAGANLALGCDIIIASEGARFSEIFVQRGLSLDYGGSWLLPRIVGLHRAKELALTGAIIDAAEAKSLGLFNHVVPDGELDTVVDGMAERLVQGAPMALAMTKSLLNGSHSMTMAQALEREAAAQVVNYSTKDPREALAAFLEKRSARFTGESSLPPRK